MIKNLLQEGFALKSKGRYKHAIEVFYKALEEDNSSSELLLEIADLYYLLQNEEKALNYIEQILTNNPTHIDALKLLKKIFIDKGALLEAEQTAKNIYCISKDNADLAEIFHLLNLQGKYDEIFEYNINAPSLEVCIEQARALYCKKEFERAEEVLKQALDLDSVSQKALLLLGEVYYAQNKKDSCISIIERLDYDSKNPELLNFIGLINTYQQKYKEAIKNFNTAIKLNRSNSVYYFNLANLYFKQGEMNFAKKYYNLAIALSPENPNYHFALANLYYTEKHYKKALEELDERLFEARLLKAIILYTTGYLALAKKEFTILLKEHADNDIVKEYREKIDKELGIN